jgi:uncharacterized protein with HEPN domain
MSRDNEILLDLVNACRSILDFTVGMSKDEFLEDTKTQSSVLYQIIIIGEAVNRISENFKSIHPEIPYAQIKGMRNRVTHEYKDVDLDIIWEAINTDIPNLLNIIQIPESG